MSHLVLDGPLECRASGLRLGQPRLAYGASRSGSPVLLFGARRTKGDGAAAERYLEEVGTHHC